MWGPKSRDINLCNLSHWLRAWKLGLTTSQWSQVPSMTWMLTWQHFLEVGLGTCVESWVEPKARPNSQHNSREHFCIKYSKSYLNEYKSYFDGFSRLKSWDFALTLGLVDMSGLGTPCEPAQSMYIVYGI